MQTLKLFVKVTLTSLLLCSCASTVIPQETISTVPSYSGKILDSGVLDVTPDGRYVRAEFVSTYNDYIKSYGNLFSPPLKANDGVLKLAPDRYWIVAQYAVDFDMMNTWKTNSVHKPPTLLQKAISL